MSIKIIIIGSTGKLGTKLLNYTSKNSIKIYGITCYTNDKKLKNQKQRYKITNSYVLSNIDDILVRFMPNIFCLGRRVVLKKIIKKIKKVEN